MKENKKKTAQTEPPIKIISFIKVEAGKTGSIVQRLKKLDSVKKILSITGNYDIIVELKVSTTDDLYEEFTKKVDIIPGLKEIHSNFVMKSWTKGGNDNDD